MALQKRLLFGTESTVSLKSTLLSSRDADTTCLYVVFSETNRAIKKSFNELPKFNGNNDGKNDHIDIWKFPKQVSDRRGSHGL